MEQITIVELMASTGVGFGTSGARGLASHMTDKVCYAYTAGFLQYLNRNGELTTGSEVGIAGDFRSSTPRIMAACAAAVVDFGYLPINCGCIPTPAVAYYGLQRSIPTLMITGSHIPDDRNGIKFNKASGEILKQDEQGIGEQSVRLTSGLFSNTGELLRSAPELPPAGQDAYQRYVRRYLDFFPANCLAGKHIGLYEHSSVAREAFFDVLTGLGAKVTRLGRSQQFIPVDTEAIRPEDTRLASSWAGEHRFDCIVSTDGDGDRPLVSDEQGRWLRGDIAGILCARFLQADAVATPVSSNTALEKSGWFRHITRTRIGSPYVIAAMNQAVASGAKQVMGYEANGGFLIASDLHRFDHILPALPTRDALIVPLSILMLADQSQCTVSSLLQRLPPRYTTSDRLKAFPTAVSQARIGHLHSGDFATDKARIEAIFREHLGSLQSIDSTDGLRLIFEQGDIVHIRASGNAPELRCYNEADSPERAERLNRTCMGILEGWRKQAS